MYHSLPFSHSSDIMVLGWMSTWSSYVVLCRNHLKSPRSRQKYLSWHRAKCSSRQQKNTTSTATTTNNTVAMRWFGYGRCLVPHRMTIDIGPFEHCIVKLGSIQFIWLNLNVRLRVPSWIFLTPLLLFWGVDYVEQ